MLNPAAHVYERDYILSRCLCANGLFYHTPRWSMISPVMSCFVAVKKTIDSVRASEEKINKKGGGEEEKGKPFFPSHMEQNKCYTLQLFSSFFPLSCPHSRVNMYMYRIKKNDSLDSNDSVLHPIYFHIIIRDGRGEKKKIKKKECTHLLLFLKDYL